MSDAHSTEMNPNTSSPVIDLMEDQKKVTAKGGTMRLGSYPCEIKDDTLAKKYIVRHALMNATATVGSSITSTLSNLRLLE